MRVTNIKKADHVFGTIIRKALGGFVRIETEKGEVNVTNQLKLFN